MLDPHLHDWLLHMTSEFGRRAPPTARATLPKFLAEPELGSEPKQEPAQRLGHGLGPVPVRSEMGPSPEPPYPPSRSASLDLAARRAFGGLLPLIDDPDLRDIFVQGTGRDARMWVDRGGIMRAVSGWQAPAEAAYRLATQLIAAGGRHLDELHPCADVHLGSGIRVHAVLPPIATGGAAISIRLPRIVPLDWTALQRGGLCNAATADHLQRLVTSRRNLLITGGTGSGKTTVLAALLDLAHSDERIVTIEDVAELRLTHPHTVALESRQTSAEGVGEVTLERLLREALRMRPDRIVLGECRGPEIATLLAALNTGHDGGAGTLHANRLEDVPARLEALGALANLGRTALARQAISALHAVVHLVAEPSGHRVAAVGTLRLRSDDTLTIDVLRS